MITELLPKEQIHNRFYRILRKWGVRGYAIRPKLNFNHDLDFDDNDWKIMQYYLEYNFNVDVPDKVLPQLSTVEKTLDYLERKL